MLSNKKLWEKPVLIILGRGTPEESVLTTCKYPGSHLGPANPNCKEPKKAECSIVAPS